MNQPSVPPDSGVHGMMEWQNSIRKDFKFSFEDTGAPNLYKRIFRIVNSFMEKAGKKPNRMYGVYVPQDKTAQVLLDAFKAKADDPEFSDEKLIDVMSDTLTHEYVHKITNEDPVFVREFDEWKKKFGGRFSILPKLKFSSAQELLAFGMMDDQVQALDGMIQHPMVEQKVKDAANKFLQGIRTEAKKNDMKATQFLRESGINPRMKVFEFLAADKEVKKSDDRESWFNVLLMETEKAAGAVTTTAPATSALFNGSYSRRKKRDKDDEEE